MTKVIVGGAIVTVRRRNRAGVLVVGRQITLDWAEKAANVLFHAVVETAEVAR